MSCRARGWPGLLAFVVVWLVAGCAIGPAGAIAGRVSIVQGGWVLETYQIGAHLRIAIADDPGLGLGAAQRTYLFAEEEISSPAPGLYVLLLPSVPLEQALLRHIETAGIDLHLGAPEPGITAGVQRLTVTRPVRADDDAFRDLRFIPSSPADACVSTLREPSC